MSIASDPFTFLLPEHKLPSNVEQRYDLLYSIFSDLHIECEKAENSWRVDLSPPVSIDFYVDKELQKGLDWWSSNQDIKSIPYSRKLTSYGKLMLNDTWTLESWASVYEQAGLSSVTILHFDHHTDLMNPLICRTGNRFSHLTSGQNFSLFDSKEITRGGVLQRI